MFRLPFPPGLTMTPDHDIVFTVYYDADSLLWRR
jgi:hypothetical protein